MKRSYITLAAIILCVSYGVLSWDIVTHSKPPGPEDSQYAAACSSKDKSESRAESTNYNMCCIDYYEALEASKKDWQKSLKKLTDQEKPASEMVDEGYESLRTYNCWVEYICLAVEYSGHAPIESVFGTGLRSQHLGIVPGCQAPEDLRMEDEYNTVMKALKEVPILGAPADAVDKAFVDNKINFFPRCITDANNNTSPSITEARSNYDACKRVLEVDFGCPTDTKPELCNKYANAFVTLENELKKSHADQKASALENKLATIIPKLHVMEQHVGYLSNFLKKLDSRFSCYAAQCD